MTGFAGSSNRGQDTIDLAAAGGEIATIQNGFADDGPVGYAQYPRDMHGISNGTSSAIAIVGGIAALRVAACGDPVDGATLANEVITNSQDRSADLVCDSVPCVAGGAFVDAGAVVSACLAAP